MLSTLLELAGFAALVAGAYVLAGLGVALLGGGCCLLFVGYATDDGAVAIALARLLGSPRRAWRRLRTKAG